MHGALHARRSHEAKNVNCCRALANTSRVLEAAAASASNKYVHPFVVYLAFVVYLGS